MANEQNNDETYNVGKLDFFNLHGKRSEEENYVRGYDEAQANWQRRFARHTLKDKLNGN